MKNILFIVGSLRQGSFNHQMAKKAESILEGKATVTYLDYKDIPMMIQRLLVALATPITTPAIEIMPSLAPSTPARKIFKRSLNEASTPCLVSVILVS